MRLHHVDVAEQYHWDQVQDDIVDNHDDGIAIEEGHDVDALGVRTCEWIPHVAERDTLQQYDEHRADAKAGGDELHEVDEVSLTSAPCETVIERQPRMLDEHVAKKIWRENGDKKLRRSQL